VVLTGVGAIRVNTDGLGVAFCDCSGVLPWLDADGGRATVTPHTHIDTYCSTHTFIEVQTAQHELQPRYLVR
jgi:hypothetical protein